MLAVLDLRLRGLGRKVSSLLLVLEAGVLVRSVAKRLALGVSAATQRDVLASGQAIRFAIHIDQLNCSFDAKGTIVANCNLGHGKSLSTVYRALMGCVSA